MAVAQGFEKSRQDRKKQSFTKADQNNLKNTLNELRLKLLNLTARNPLINFRHKETNKNQIRAIDEIIDIMFEKLYLKSQNLEFLSLSEPDFNPPDEKTEKFINELEIAKQSDEEYLKELEILPEDDDGLSKKSQEILRRLKDRVRDALGMEKRKHPDLMSKKEYAKLKDKLNPDYNLPKIEKGQNLPKKWYDQKIQTLLFPEELTKNLETINRKYKESFSEKGINTLYIVFGFLEWYESKSSDRKLLSPIIILPIDIKRSKTGKKNFYISATGDNPVLNLTLIERLKRDFDLNLPNFDEETVSIEDYLKKFQNKIKDKNHWSVKNFITIGHFNYMNISVYNDLNPDQWQNPGQLLENEVLHEIIFGKEGEGGGSNEDYNIDSDDIKKITPFVVSDADASQHSAIVDICKGENMALKGPPGTGKSQTITNAIGACLAQGKKVLFISAKSAALDVVYARLRQAGLEEFCLKLHGISARKKEFLGNIKKRLDLRVKKDSEDFKAKSRQHQKIKNKLNDYADLMNSHYGDINQTIHQIIWLSLKYEKIIENLELKKLKIKNIHKISQPELDDMCKDIEGAQDIISNINKKFGNISKHPFYLFNNFKLSRFEIDEYFEDIALFLNQMKSINQNLEDVKSNFNFQKSDYFSSKLNFEKISSTILKFETNINIHDQILKNHDNKFNYSDILNILNQTENCLKNLEQNKYNNLIEDLDTSKINNVLSNIANHEESYQSDLGDLYINDQNGVDKLFTNRARNLNSVINFLSEIQKDLDVNFDYNNISLTKINNLNDITKLYDDKFLIFKNKHHFQIESLSFIELILSSFEKIESKIEKLSNQIDIDFDLSINELNNHITKINQSSWFNKLYGDTKKAFLFYELISKSSEKNTSKTVIFKILNEYLDLLKDITAFNNSDPVSTLSLNFQLIHKNIKELHTYKNILDLMNSELANSTNIENSFRDFFFKKDNNALILLKAKLQNFDFDKYDLTQEINFQDKLQNENSLKDKTLSFISSFNNTFGNHQIKFNELNEFKNSLNNKVQTENIFSENKDILDVYGISINSKSTYVNDLIPSIDLYSNIQNTFINDLDEKGVYQSLDLNNGITQLKELKNILDDTNTSLNKNFDLLQKIIKNFDCDLTSFITEKIDAAEFQKLVGIFSHFEDNRDEIFEYFDYLKVKQNKESTNIVEFFEVIEKNHELVNQLSDAFLFVFYNSLVKEIYNKYPDLKTISGTDIQTNANKFNDLDIEINNLHAKDLIGTLKSIMPEKGIGHGKKRDLTEMGLIKHLVESENPKIPSIRNIMERAGNAIIDLKPCFMMSPYSVAQFLRNSKFQFDVIFIDEASQLQPQLAIGAIARCNQAVIMGDPMQLPPTEFFERDVDLDEDEEVERVDEKSILDQALTRFRTRRELKWHYRSKDESLIAFSNKEFYENKLVIFPSPNLDKNISGINIEYIQATYKGRQNVEEAKLIVQRAVEYCKNNSEKSALIATMNLQQKNLIEDLLNKEITNDQKFQDYYAKWEEGLEPFVVKNLESVQGDERDSIFISTLFGPQEVGLPVMQHFGPINSKAGHRRLNVLFTRAKERVHIVTSLKTSDIKADDDATIGRNSYGRKVLKNYLEFAHTGKLYGGEDTDRESGSEFQDHIANVLKQKGYEVKQEIGVAGYFIDIGIRHPSYPNGYLLGVEADGATYHSSKSARDRDRLRQQVLEGLGWTLYRVWSTDWYNHQENETEKLVNFIEQQAELKKQQTKH